MTYQVLKTLKVKTKQGKTIIFPGQIIELNPSKAESLLAQGKIKLTTIEEILDSILSNIRDRIIEEHKSKQYRATEEIRGIEDEIDRVYKAVLDSQATISDLESACEKWLLLCKENLKN